MNFSKRHTRSRRRNKNRKADDVSEHLRLVDAERNWHIFNGNPTPIRDIMLEVAHRVVNKIIDRHENQLAELIFEKGGV